LRELCVLLVRVFTYIGWFVCKEAKTNGIWLMDV